MQLVLEVGAAGVECISVPGWSVVVVASLLAAPRLLRLYLVGPSKETR